jgi:hypothetical protein
MHTLTTRRELCSWLSQRLLDTVPKRRTSQGVLAVYERLIATFMEGDFSVDRACWGEQLDADFLLLMNSTSSQMLPEAIADFVSDIYGRAINSDVVRIEEAIEVLIHMLDYEHKYVQLERVGTTRCVVSTAKCVRQLKTTIRVKLGRVEYAYITGCYNDDGLHYRPLWWRNGR